MKPELEATPKLGFGCMRLPLLDPADQQSIDMEQFKQMVDAFIDGGGTYFDTAFGYHEGASERALKEALVERYPRDAYTVATKCLAWAAPSAEEAKSNLATSLERMGLDYVDFYLLHNVGGDRTAKFDAYGMWDFALDAKERGLIRNVGFSMHDGADALDALLTAHPQMDFVQLQVNYLDWDDPVVEARRCMEIAEAHGVPVVVMEPARGGRLVELPERVADVLRAANPDASLASWAYRFCCNQPNVLTVLSGMSNLDQVRQNVADYQANRPFSAEEQQALDAAAEDLARVQSLSLVSRPLEGDFVYNRAAADGPVDRLLRGFVLRRDAKRPVALLSAACHGVFRGRVPLVSADFAGAVNHLAEERGYAPLYLNGLCGDIDPWNPSPERMEGFARQIASLLDAEGKPLPLDFQAGNIPFVLYHPSVSLAEIHAAAADAVRRAGGETAPAARVARAWERKMAKRAHALPTEEALKASYLLLGGVPILALPFEGFTRIGMDIRRKLGRRDALVLGCAEELMGYLPTRDDLARGAYAALESTFLYGRLPVLAGEAERLGEELGEALERRML